MARFNRGPAGPKVDPALIRTCECGEEFIGVGPWGGQSQGDPRMNRRSLAIRRYWGGRGGVGAWSKARNAWSQHRQTCPARQGERTTAAERFAAETERVLAEAGMPPLAGRCYHVRRDPLPSGWFRYGMTEFAYHGPDEPCPATA